MPRATPSTARPATAVAPLAAAANLGPVSAQMLAAVGITTLTQLRRVGAVAAYVRARRADRRASLNLLYALVGALEGEHWQTVRRTRKLELVTAVEDHERAHPPASRAAVKDELLALRNIGPAMRKDFALLGIRSRAQLARADADTLYRKIQRLTRTRHDPCVWDTYAAAIHEARGGTPQPWWHFTRERKRRQTEGSFVTLPPIARAAHRAPASTAKPPATARTRAAKPTRPAVTREDI